MNSLFFLNCETYNDWSVLQFHLNFLKSFLRIYFILPPSHSPHLERLCCVFSSGPPFFSFSDHPMASNNRIHQCDPKNIFYPINPLLDCTGKSSLACAPRDSFLFFAAMMVCRAFINRFWSSKVSIRSEFQISPRSDRRRFF